MVLSHLIDQHRIDDTAQIEEVAGDLPQVPKPVEWGDEISQAEAWQIMAEAQGAPPPDFGTPADPTV
jgi:hypothetical protein